jgi:hypothetical protein
MKTTINDPSVAGAWNGSRFVRSASSFVPPTVRRAREALGLDPFPPVLALDERPAASDTPPVTLTIGDAPTLVRGHRSRRTVPR